MSAPAYPGAVTPPARRPTSSDVAARAGVSRATVSMVLNGRVEGTVAPATRERVLRAAAELDYTRSSIALSLRDRRTRTIGLITDEISTSPWAGRMIRAAAQEAAAQDYLVLTVDLSLRDADVAAAMRGLAARQVEGFVYAEMGHARKDLPPVPQGLPLVMLNGEQLHDGDGVAEVALAVVPDDRGGAVRATRRLLDVGHRRIVMLSSGDAAVATVEREAGYRAAMEEAGLSPEVVRAGWQMSDGLRETRRLLARAEPPTAVLCIRDRVAAGAIHAAALAGVDVPRELSVIGYDDEDFFAEELTPPLTTIALPHEEMGALAMRALLTLLEDGNAGEDGGAGPTVPRVEVVPCPLVERGTVAAAPEPA